MMRVVFAGGSTGGHIYPGIAVARALQRISSSCEVEFWGAGRPLERTILERENVTFRALPSAPMPRSPLKLPGFAWKVVSGYFAARRLLSGLDVSAVVGLGGYSSYAPVVAASHRGLATLLLEQNALMGKANVRLARRAGLVCLTWQDSAAHIPPGVKFEVTGNPLRSEVVAAARDGEYRSDGALLVMGGSTGAVGLNTIVLGALREIRNLGRRIVHQTGEQDFHRVKSVYEQAGIEAEILPFIEDVAGAYRQAALIVARAGGTTLSETALFALPSILVPYPHHKDRHQSANAEIFARLGAAEIIEESSGAPPALANRLKALFGEPGRLSGMSAASLSLGKSEAAEVIAGRILEMC